MRGENEFNRHLSKELKKLKPKTFHLKVSDRFQSGVSDFLLIRDGRAVALEVKFVKKVGSGEAKLLSHPFTGPQLSFFRNVVGSGGKAFGLIAVGSERKFYLIPFSNISSGNWSKDEFIKYQEVFSDFDYDRRVFAFKDVEPMVDRLFKEDSNDTNKEPA